MGNYEKCNRHIYLLCCSSVFHANIPSAAFQYLGRRIFLSILSFPMTAINWAFFQRELINWYRPDRRPMPWKAIRNPYLIWLSEIILQQTRVEQGWPYYQRFTEAYPTVNDLAAAPDDEVMKLWEGLGYYSRARNLLKAARMVSGEYHGIFPNNFSALRTLPGVGPYTAAAIASFVFDEQVAVLDGNVFRILARFKNDTTPIDTGKGRKHYEQLAENALGNSPARVFNQAIMDFGALVCTPRNAGCNTCPLAEECAAKAAQTVYELPVKAKSITRRDRYFHFLIINDPVGNTIIEQRGKGDIWQALYQFPLVETETPGLAAEALPLNNDWPPWLSSDELSFVRSSPPAKHQLTHQTIIVVFHHFTLTHPAIKTTENIIVENKMLKNFAFPRAITRYLSDKSLLLDLF